ncbi:MAG: prephenate dehydrogenase/arogenate dehydrogenase family protein [Candidatus Omnitrophota bacterium]|jgi:prephenate dehydrogenase
MPLFNKVAIIGVGLIGGSLGLDIKKRGLAREVVGISRHKKSILLALKKKAIDRGSLSLSIIKGADLVILATPVKAIINLRESIIKYISKGCIITDVGSTKGAIGNSLEGIFPNYVGSHPLAGSEKRGIANASLGIFDGSLCVLTLGRNKVSSASLKKIKAMWNKLGAKTIMLTSREHDKYLAFSSHLPHISAYSLIDSIPRKALRFSAGGLKDTTRIAASDPLLWSDILLTNRDNLLKAINSFEHSLKKIKSAVKANDARSLRKILSQSKIKRDSME